MVKRGRDDDGAVAPAPAVEPARQRHYLAIRRALNDQFVADLTRKLTQNPTRRFDKEVADYEKFSRQLRVRLEPRESSSTPRPRRDAELDAEFVVVHTLLVLQRLQLALAVFVKLFLMV